MKNLKVAIVLVLIASVAVSCGQKPAAESSVSAADTTVYRVKTVLLEKQKVSQDIELTANLMPYEEINYAPASPGRIEEITVEVGKNVKKGDVIARMDRTQLQQSQESYENARLNFVRMDTLRKLNSISEQAYESTKTLYEVAKSSYEFMSKNTTLVSPINGIVTGKYYETGELYSGAPNTPAGKAAIVTLMQINPMKILVNVSERFYPAARKGMKASVTVDIFPDKTFTGEVSQVYPTINTESRTFPVEIIVRNENEILRPGMFSRVKLNFGAIDAMVLPALAVLRQEGTNDRYVFMANGVTAKKVMVGTGRRYDDKLEIISNELKEGDKIIIAGHDKLIDNSNIALVD
jgi:membrane fusion protein (multidrug efflux system)